MELDPSPQKSFTRAAELYARGCNKGRHAGACFRVAELSAEVGGKLHDRRRLLEFGKKGCELSHAPSCALVAAYYLEGDDRNDERGEEFARKACDGGSASGCASLGVLKVGGNSEGPDFASGVKLLERACTEGAGSGCFALSGLYALGRGVEQDDARAHRLLQQGCDGGHGRACFELGMAYDGASRVVTHDKTKAAGLFEKSCALKLPEGCLSLAQALLGGVGVQTDAPRAAALITALCDSGEAAICGMLGDLYEKGRGVERNVERARTLKQKACEGRTLGYCASR
ncbi:tetratricopeptide repeat protein [Corallococcus sp. M7]